MRKMTIIIWLQLIGLIASAQDQEWFSETDISGLNFPGAARNNAVSFVIGDTAYVGTGDRGANTLADFWKYAPATNTWTQIASLPGDATRSGAVAFVLGGKGYVGTGKGGGQLLNDFYRYDPATGAWEAVADFGGGPRRNAVAFVVNGRAYVGTGNTTSGFSSYTDDLWEYDPNADQWTEKTTKVPGKWSGATAFSIGSKGYITGGFGTNFKNIYEYDPATDTYERGGKNEFAYPREDGVAFVLDGKAYVGLGTEKNDFLAFDPSVHMSSAQGIDSDGPEDQFNETAEPNRFGAVAFVVRGKAFVGLGGYASDSGTPNDLSDDFVIQKQDIWSFQSPVPDTPERLAAVAALPDSITLRWVDYANNEQNFRIERSEDANVFSLLGTSEPNVTQYSDKSILADREYFYRVRANGATHNSLYGDTVVVNTYTAPTDLSAEVLSATEIKLQWQDNSSGEHGFAIKRSTNGVSFGTIDTVAADVTAYNDATAVPGTDYTYRVYAIATVTASTASNTVTAGSLIAPTSLTATALSGAAIQLTWTYDGNNAAWYLVERRTAESGFVLIDSVAGDASPQYRDNTVGEGTRYEYRVKAKDHPRSSSYSSLASATSELLAPASVTASLQDTIVTVTWEDRSALESHYVIWRSIPDSTGLLRLDSLSADITTYIDHGITQSGEYRYYVQAVGGGIASDSVASNTVAVTIPEATTEEEEEKEGEQEEETEDSEEEEVITGTDDPAEESLVGVYPNPGRGLINVYVGDERFAYVAVFNGQGQLVNETQQAEQAPGATVTVDIQHLPAGMYTLRIYTKKGVFVRKVAKQ